MPMDQFAKCVDGGDHARDNVTAVEHRAIDFKRGLPGEARKLSEQSAVEAEEQAQVFGDRPHRQQAPHLILIDNQRAHGKTTSG